MEHIINNLHQPNKAKAKKYEPLIKKKVNSWQSSLVSKAKYFNLNNVIS